MRSYTRRSLRGKGCLSSLPLYPDIRRRYRTDGSGGSSLSEENDYSYLDPPEPWDEYPPDPAMDEELWNEVMREYYEMEDAR